MKKVDWDKLETCMGSLFFDSGAHSLWNTHIRGKDLAKEETWEFYDSGEFELYLDSYVAFIKKYHHVIDHYASVDVIRHPERSWEVLQYLTNKGIKPVPVLHYGASVKELERHLEEGYDMIGIGGVSQSDELTPKVVTEWCDKLFEVICPRSNGYLPIAKMHGFAMTGRTLIQRYPWWSVDSTSWLKMSAYGRLYVPGFLRGEWAVRDQAHIVPVSSLRRDQKIISKKKVEVKVPSFFGDTEVLDNLENNSRAIKSLTLKWLDYTGVPVGSWNGDEKEYGVVTSDKARSKANLIYFEHLRMAEPEWPWPCEGLNSQGGFFKESFVERKKKFKRDGKLRIYYSGNGVWPEDLISDHKPGVMLTYYNIFYPDATVKRRFEKHLDNRKKIRNKNQRGEQNG